MDKYDLLLSLYQGRTINKTEFDKYFSPNGTSETEFVHEVLTADGYYVNYRLIATVNNDVVVSLRTSKTRDSFAGHGRPRLSFGELNKSEWKYAYSLFDLCFPNPYENELKTVIENALDKKCEYNGFRINRELKNYIEFISPDGSPVKLKKERIMQAISYSHIELSILKKPEKAREFADCFGDVHYEPLYAVIFDIDPSVYTNYEELNYKFRFEELKRVIEQNDFDKCKELEDIVKKPNDSLYIVGYKLIAAKDEIVDWFFDCIPQNSCNFNHVLSSAIENDREKIVQFIFDKKLFNPDCSSSDWHGPMGVATSKQPKYVLPLLEHDFELSSFQYLATLTLDQIKEILKYRVVINKDTINRIIEKSRYDILEIIENKPGVERFGATLLSSYIKAKDFNRFKTGVEKGWHLNVAKHIAASLFENAYNNDSSWSDIMLENGFDINQSEGMILLNACRDLKVDFAIYLMEHGADPHLKEAYSPSAFEFAAEYNCYKKSEKEQKEKLCRYLLDKDVDPIMESTSTPSIFQYLLDLSSNFKEYLVDWIYQHGQINYYECANDKSISDIGLLECVIGRIIGKYDSNLFKRLISYGIDVDVKSKSSSKLFIDACATCTLEDLKLFVGAGGDITEIDNRYHTNGLFEAVARNRGKDVIEYLLDLGLDVNSTRTYIKSDYFNTTVVKDSVLDIAKKSNNKEVIDLLIEHGAKCAKDLY